MMALVIFFETNYRDRPDTANEFKKIAIHDNCFVGMNSIILPGVTIGLNSIVGAGSVITRDVPTSEIIVGAPARKVGTLDEYINKYKQKMIPIQANNRKELRRELTLYYWGEKR